MTDFKQEVVNSNLPRGFRPVRLNLNGINSNFNINQSNQSTNQSNNHPNASEVIYDEPCSNFDSNHQIPPPLPSSQPPNSSTIQTNNDQKSIAQPFWSLPSQEQQQLQQHLTQHLSRSPTPTFGQNLLNAENIQKVITNKDPPANAEFLYETDAFKFYTVPTGNERKVINIKQNTNKKEIQGLGPVNENGIPLTLRTGISHRHGSDWYKTMFKNMHVTDKPKWMYEEPIKIKKTKKAKKEEPLRNEFIYDNQTSITNQIYEDDRRKKKELQKEIQRKNPYICDESETKYIIKKKKSSRSKSPVSRKTYAMIQKGEDIPFSGLNKPAPNSKNNKNEFYDQEQTDLITSRTPSPKQKSPTSICLTYPASDYVPERPPTPQYNQQFVFNQQTTHQYNSCNNSQLNSQINNKPVSQVQSNFYSQKLFKNKEKDFTSIDEWQRKLNDDFDQLYTTLERNFELKRLRDTGKLISPVPPSENRRDTGYRTAKELYLNQSASPKPPSRRYNLETLYNPNLTSDIVEDTQKTNQFKSSTTNYSTKRDWLDSSNKLNRYNSSQDLNYLNPNNKTYDLNNNYLFNTGNESIKKSIYQHSSLDNLNSNLNSYSAYDQPTHNYNYKIFAQPTTTRTYTESTYYDTNTLNKPVIDLKSSKTSNSFQFQKQTSLLDIEKQLNEQFGDLLRSGNSFEERKDNFKQFESNESPITIKVTRAKSPPINESMNTELERLSNTVNQSTKKSIIEDAQQESPLDLKPNQDVNNISFQMEDDVDLDKLIKKIEQDAIIQDELGMY